MSKIVVILYFVFISFGNFCFADFVDVATVKVNDKLVRKMARNNFTPYLICLSEFNPNDTLTISVWTDYFGENNSYLTYLNKTTNEIDTVSRNSPIILTEEMIRTPYLYSVTFIHNRNNNVSLDTWEIFETRNEPKIEKAYSDLNFFIDGLKAEFSISNDYFLDSIECNILSSVLDTRGSRLVGDTVLVSRNEIFDLFVLTDEEREYLSGFNSKDYVQLYNLDTRMYGQIYLDQNDINWISLRIANFSGSKLRLNFVFQENRFKLKSVLG